MNIKYNYDKEPSRWNNSTNNYHGLFRELILIWGGNKQEQDRGVTVREE